MEAKWNNWKKAEVDEEPWKLATQTLTLQTFYRFWADVVIRCLLCETGSFSELSGKKYSVLMALEDQIRGNWAEFFLERLVLSVKKNEKMMVIEGERFGGFTSSVSFGLKVSLLIEKLMGLEEVREELLSTDFFPSKEDYESEDEVDSGPDGGGPGKK